MSPTDSRFHTPQIQTKSSKYIKYLCAEDKLTLQRWVTGCRIAKYGRIMKDNYDNLMRDIVEEDLETLAHARSFSISSMARAAVSPDSGSPELGQPVVLRAERQHRLWPDHYGEPCPAGIS
ncbi:hypothetical protein MTO96_011420 [Rhipicephalus appendiculatus]